MPVTYKLISTVTVGSGGAATIDFTNIPAIYDDLIVKASTRMETGASEIRVRFNGSAVNYSTRYLQGSGSSASSGTAGTIWIYVNEDNYATYTANTFANTEIYIPNYVGNTNKSMSSDSVVENNATAAYSQLTAGLWSDTSAINQVTLHHVSGDYDQYSSASLYGIKRT